jgi:hypothetical protein
MTVRFPFPYLFDGGKEEKGRTDAASSDLCFDSSRGRTFTSLSTNRKRLKEYQKATYCRTKKQTLVVVLSFPLSPPSHVLRFLKGSQGKRTIGSIPPTREKVYKEQGEETPKLEIITT